MSNAYRFRMPTHVPAIGEAGSAVEEADFELAIDNTMEALFETLHKPATAYAVARATGTSDDEYNDCVVQLQRKYVRMVLGRVLGKLE